MQLVADRFALEDRGHAIDLASGERVHLVWSAAGGASEQTRWASRCAFFASLHHVATARLLDYGGVGESQRFEAWQATGEWQGNETVAREVVSRANRFLAAMSLTPMAGDACAAAYGGRVVAVPDASAGLAGDATSEPGRGADLPVDLFGIAREPDRRIAAMADVFASRSAPRTVALSIWGEQVGDVSDAIGVLARAARLAGIVPVCPRALTPDIRRLLTGRTLLIVARDGADEGWQSLLRTTLADPRAHMVLFAGADTMPRVHTIPLQQWSPEALAALVCPEPASPHMTRRVADAARRARGRPALFEQLLWGASSVPGSVPVQAASRAAEQTAAFGLEAPSAATADASKGARRSQAWPALTDLARLRRQLEAARGALACGRLAKGERTARQATSALARRGDWTSAGEGAVALAEALARHGRIADADRVLTDARAWASEARDCRLLRAVAIVTGRVLTDAGRLSDAQAMLESVLASAASSDAPERVTAARMLARCLYWQGRYDEAWQQLAVHASGPLAERDAIKVAVARSRIAIGRRQVADAISESARARDAARAVHAPDLVASSCYAWAMAQLAAGDCTLADTAAAEALVAARQSRRTQLALCAHLLRGEIARRRGSSRLAAVLVARLSRLSASRLPPIVRARADLLRDACGAPDVEAAARERAALSGFQALLLLVPAPGRLQAQVAAEAIAELLQCCQAAEEDAAVLTALAGRLRARLRATAVAFLASDQGQFVQLAGDGGRVDAAMAARVHAVGQLVMPHQAGDRVEAGAPVRYAGRVIGLLVARWPPAATWDGDAVSMLLSTGAAAAGPAVSGAIQRRDAAASSRTSDLIGVSAAIRDVRNAIDRAAGAPFPVLILGESGSGKELAARLLHRRSPRRDRPFCALNCAALPDDLAESELFGHARGAFTGAHGERQGVFEEAHGGTLFLDEIGELSLRAQAKVLRTIQEGEVRRVGENTCRRVDVRLVAATNRDLRDEVAAGRFRMDLLYRLDVIRIALPPLRARRDDILLLTEHFWREATGRIGSRATLSTATLAALARYDWPGNIRELQNVLAALAVRSPRRGVVMPTALPPHVGDTVAEAPLALEEARRAFDRRFVRDALSRAGGHRARAAEELGVTRQGLTKLMARLRIDDGSPETADG